MLFITILVLTLVTSPNIDAQTYNYNNEWLDWKTQYNKVYSTMDEDSYRYSIFEFHLNNINRHNAKNLSYTLGLNEFSDLSYTELTQKFYSNIDITKVKINAKKAIVANFDSVTDIPDTVNWRRFGFLGPVRNQKYCGSSYLFSTISAIESAYAIKNNLTNAVKKFSVQQLLDCSYNKYNLDGVLGNSGCNGGYNYHSLYYSQEFGVTPSNLYPTQYSGSTGRCQYDSTNVATKVSGIYTATDINGNIRAIKAAVAQQPVLTYIYAPLDFFHYKSGVYNPIDCARGTQTECPTGVNFAVLLSGFYFVSRIKQIFQPVDYANTWISLVSLGKSWGEDGFMNIPMGENTCCSEMYTYYPVVN